MVRELGEAGVTDQDVQQYMQMVSAIKSSRAVRQANGDPSAFPRATSTLVNVYRYYQSFLERGGLMDFADQVNLAVTGMMSGTVPLVPYTHLLIDEYQDSDEIQVDWATMHANAGKIVTVVGDDDQSIYGFRGGSGYEAFRPFEHNSPNVTRVVLDQNYRSHQEILDIANKVIQNNTSRIPKKLVANKGAGGKVEIVRGHNPNDELLRISEIIRESIERNPSESWALLARVNLDLFKVEQIFNSVGVPFVSANKYNPIKTRFPKAYMSMLERFEHDLNGAVFDVLMLYGISHDSIDFHMERRDMKSYRDFCDMGEEEISQFVAAMPQDDKEKWKAALSALSGISAIEFRWKHGQTSSVLRYFYKEVIEQHPEYDPERYSPVMDVLFSTMKKIKSRSLKGKVTTMRRMIDEKEQKDKTLEQGSNKGKVVLMTMHSSKGLEFDNVVIPFCNEGYMPSKTAIKEAEQSGSQEEMQRVEEEERRLFYVAMTRARKRLIMSYHGYTFKPFMKFSDYVSHIQNGHLEMVVKDAIEAGKSGKKEAGKKGGKTKRGEGGSSYYELIPAAPSRYILESELVSPLDPIPDPM